MSFNTFTKAHQYIENGYPKKAVNYVYGELVSNSFYKSDFKEERIKELKLLNSRLERIKNEEIRGTITDEAKRVELNKVSLSLLDQLQLIEAYSETENIQIEVSTTIKKFAVLILLSISFSALFASIIFAPRKYDVASAILILTTTFTVLCSALVILFLLFRYYKSPLYIGRGIFLLVIAAFLLLQTPRIISYHVLGESKQTEANDRFESGLWSNAMEIYLYEHKSLSETSIQNIKRMQHDLKTAGYYVGDVNGIPSENIINSLKQLQTDFKLEPDGFLGRMTKNAMYSIIYSKKLGVKEGEKDMSIINRKIMEFQANNGLTADGTIGTNTLIKLSQ